MTEQVTLGQCGVEDAELIAQIASLLDSTNRYSCPSALCEVVTLAVDLGEMKREALRLCWRLTDEPAQARAITLLCAVEARCRGELDRRVRALVSERDRLAGELRRLRERADRHARGVLAETHASRRRDE